MDSTKRILSMVVLVQEELWCIWDILQNDVVITEIFLAWKEVGIRDAKQKSIFTRIDTFFKIWRHNWQSITISIPFLHYVGLNGPMYALDHIHKILWWFLYVSVFFFFFLSLSVMGLVDEQLFNIHSFQPRSWKEL